MTRPVTAPPVALLPMQGLEVDPLTGYIVARPTSGEWPRIGADQEGWAAQVCGQGSADGLEQGWLSCRCTWLKGVMQV